MKNTTLTPLLLALTIFVSVSPGAFAQPPTLRQQFEAILRQRDAELARKDPDKVTDTETKDYKQVGTDGKTYNKASGDKAFRAICKMARSLKGDTRLIDVKLVQGEAVLLSHEHTTVEIVGKRTGKKHTLIFDGNWRSIWVKTKQGWKARLSKHLSQTITRDGVKIVRPTAAKKP